MSAVEATLKRLIRAQGPLPLARYMAESLFHPEGGYYSTGTVFGREGDFITAPEISQSFGELIGLWAADFWQRAGAPAPFNLVELGPGRGTLMADFLRATRIAPGFLEAASLHLVEASPRLKEIQAERLKESGLRPTWHDGLETLPAGFSIVIANEFFDALPISQYQFSSGAWQERRVGLDEDNQFAWTLAPGAPPPDYLPDSAPNEGDMLETSMPSLSMLRSMTERLTASGGVALIIDYGYVRPAYGDTFQALRGHQYWYPLKEPGQADLTAHVNFGLLARVAQDAGAEVHGPVTQGHFLSAIGLEARARQLLAGAKTEEQRQVIASGVKRLVAPDEMGDIFKVMAVSAPGAPAPAGFEGA